VLIRSKHLPGERWRCLPISLDGLLDYDEVPPPPPKNASARQRATLRLSAKAFWVPLLDSLCSLAAESRWQCAKRPVATDPAMRSLALWGHCLSSAVCCARRVVSQGTHPCENAAVWRCDVLSPRHDGRRTARRGPLSCRCLLRPSTRCSATTTAAPSWTCSSRRGMGGGRALEEQQRVRRRVGRESVLRTMMGRVTESPLFVFTRVAWGVYAERRSGLPSLCSSEMGILSMGLPNRDQMSCMANAERASGLPSLYSPSVPLPSPKPWLAPCCCSPGRRPHHAGRAARPRDRLRCRRWFCQASVSCCARLAALKRREERKRKRMEEEKAAAEAAAAEPANKAAADDDEAGGEGAAAKRAKFAEGVEPMEADAGQAEQVSDGCWQGIALHDPQSQAPLQLLRGGAPCWLTTREVC
jgi:hypothetical protein